MAEPRLGNDLPRPGLKQDPGPSGTSTHGSIQDAINEAEPGATVRIGPGLYEENVVIDKPLTLIGAGREMDPANGSVLSVLDDDAPALRITDNGPVRISGFALLGGSQPALAPEGDARVTMRGSLLSAASGPAVRLDASASADLRLNAWSASTWSDVRSAIEAPLGAGLLAAPFLLPDGAQDPPAPSVAPSGHCSAADFAPRFIEEAVWCAHPDGTVVLHPSLNAAAPTPHQPSGVDDPFPATLALDRNRILTGIDGIGDPQWGAFNEPLNGLTLCSAPGTSNQDPPEPGLGAACAPDPATRQATVIDPGDPTVTPGVHVLAADVNLTGLRFRMEALTGPGVAILGEAAGTDIMGNLIEGPPLGNGDPLADQFGIQFKNTASGYAVEGNEIRSWSHGGVYIGDSTDGPGTIGPDNHIHSTGRSAILAAHKDAAAAGTLITGNTIGPNGLRGINLEASDGTIVEGNQISLDLLALGETAPGSGTGVWVQGAKGARLNGNVFSGHDAAAVSVTGLAAPASTVVALDGTRGAAEGYTFMLTDDDPVQAGPADVTFYGAHDLTSVYFHIETATGQNIWTGNLFFDVNGNDAWDGQATDRIAYLSGRDVFADDPNGVIDVGDYALRADGKAFEVRIDASYAEKHPFNYDMWLNDASVRNTGWENAFYAQMHSFQTSPALLSISEVEDLVLRQNAFRLVDAEAASIRIGQDVSGLSVDARLNDWGVYGHRVLPQRVVDLGTDNQVLQIPFLLPDGAPEPSLPTSLPATHSNNAATCNAHQDAEFVDGACRFLTVQAAIDFSHPDGVVLLPGSADPVDPTPYFEALTVAQNNRPATLGGPQELEGLTICSTADGSGCATETDLALTRQRTVIDAGPDPQKGALPTGRTTMGLDAADVTVQGLTIRNQGLAGPGQGRLLGVALGTSPDAAILDNLVELTPEGCATLETGPACWQVDDQFVQAIYADEAAGGAPGALIAGNVVRSVPGPDGSIGGNGMRGNIPGGLVEGNLFTGWSDGTVPKGAEVQIRGNAFVGSWNQLLLCATGNGDPTLVENNAVLAGNEAIVLLAGCNNQNIGLHNNRIGLANTIGLSVQDRGFGQPGTVDAECNDWGLYHSLLIPLRINDERGVIPDVDFEPFISPSSSSGPLECLVPIDASFTVEALDADPPDSTTRYRDLQFTDTSTSDKPIVRWMWDFGAGEATSTEQNPSYRFQSVGTKSVTLRVEDADGQMGAAMMDILVTPCSTESGAATVHLIGGGSFCTVQQAVDAAGAGATIALEPDTYFESVDLSQAAGGLTLCPGSASGCGAGEAILDGAQAADTPGAALRLDDTNGVTVRDLVLIGTGAAAVTAHGASGLLLQGNTLQGGTNGLRADDPVGLTVDGNRFDGQLQGINLQGFTDIEILNNQLEGCGACIFLGGLGSGSGALLAGNTMSPDGSTPLLIPSGALASGMILQGSGILSRDNLISAPPPGLNVVGIQMSIGSDVRSLRDSFGVLQTGISIGSASSPPVGVVIREADLSGAARALSLESGLADVTIDARLNNWGVDQWRLIPTRFDDGGASNTILHLPFLLSDGTPEPGLPTASPASHSNDPAVCSAHDADGDGFPDADWVDRDGIPASGDEYCRFLTVQAAIDFSHADGRVVVPMSQNGADPTPYLENLAIGANSESELLAGLTLCGSVVAMECAPVNEPARFALSTNTQWGAPPVPHQGQAVRMGTFSSTSLFLNEFLGGGPVPVDEITGLGVDILVDGPGCPASDPRITLRVDTTGDGVDDTNYHVYPPDDFIAACNAGELAGKWVHIDYLGSDNWGGASLGTTQAGAAAMLGPGHRVLRMNLIWDAATSDMVAWTDNQRYQDSFFSEASDACNDAEDATCFAEEAQPRTIIDATGSGSTVLSIGAERVSAQGLTLRWTGTPSTSVRGIFTNNDDVVIQGNAIRLEGGGCSADAIAGGQTCWPPGVPQVTGIQAGGGAERVQVLENLITGSAVSTSDGTVGSTNGITGVLTDWTLENNTLNWWAANAVFPSGGTTGLTVAGNVFRNVGTGVLLCSEASAPLGDIEVVGNVFRDNLKAFQLCADPGPSDASIRDNEMGLTNLEAMGLDDRTHDLVVDAECNDWGVYHADLIPDRINDEGTNNMVDFQPFVGANTAEEALSCLARLVADFAADPLVATPHLPVEFTDESQPADKDITSWMWEFGGDGTSTTQNPSHTFTTPGDYDVTLTVRDLDGMVDTITKTDLIQVLDCDTATPDDTIVRLSGGTFCNLQDALDGAGTDDTILLEAGHTHFGNFVVPPAATGLTLCQGNALMTMCGSDPADVVLEATGSGPVLTADDTSGLTVEGATLRGGGVSTVQANRATDLTLRGLIIEGASMGLAAEELAGALVEDTHFAGGHDFAVLALGFDDVVVADNTVDACLFCIVLAAPLGGATTQTGALVADNNITIESLGSLAGIGISLEGTNLATRSNTIRAADPPLGPTGILLGATQGALLEGDLILGMETGISLEPGLSGQPEGVVVRNAQLSDAATPMRLAAGVQDVVVDARLNAWGFDSWRLAELRIDDEGTDNTVLQLPLLRGDGTPDPPLVTASGATHSSTQAGCDAHVGPFGFADTWWSGAQCHFLTVQAALDHAHPGGTVAVPMSEGLDPAPRFEEITIETNNLPDMPVPAPAEPLSGVTLCATVAVGTCAPVSDAARFALSTGSQWGAPPVPHQGQAIRMAGPAGSTSLFLNSFLGQPLPQIGDLEALGFDMMLESGTCAGGSPRITLRIDTDSDAAADLNYHVYRGSGVPCPPAGRWVNVDLTASDQWGNIPGDTQADAHPDLVALSPDYGIVSMNLIWDGGGAGDIAWFDNQRYQNAFFREPADACNDVDDPTCLAEEARPGTILDSTGTGTTVLRVVADDVTVEGLTLRHTGVPPSSVVGADLSGTTGTRLEGNAIRLQGGGCSLEDIAQGRCVGPGRPHVQGVAAHPATGATIEGNLIVADLVGPDGTLGGTNGITGSFLGATIRSNELRAWGANAVSLGGGQDNLLQDNVFNGNGDGVLACADGTLLAGNAFRNHVGAVLPCGSGLVLRHNDLGLTNLFGVRFPASVADLKVDARLNDWGVYEQRLLPARVLDQGTDNVVMQIPFLLPDGSVDPGVPTI